MSRMLFLRDIDGDVRIRCLSCGHEGRLARADLVRRYGPAYPVLSLAPHFRCSRCNGRDTETRPLVEDTPPPPALPPEPDTGTAIAALRGFASAIREAAPPREPEPTPPPAHGGAGASWNAGDLLNSLLDSLDEDEDKDEDKDEGSPDAGATAREVETSQDAPGTGETVDETVGAEIEGEDEPLPFPFPRPPEEEDAASGERFDETLAALRAFIGDGAAPGDVESEEEPEEVPGGSPSAAADEAGEGDWDDGEEPDDTLHADTPEAFFRGLGRLDVRESGGEEDPADDAEDPLNETIAALRSFAGPGDTPEDEHEDEAPDDEDDFSDEEILSFAIRDREAPPTGTDEDEEPPLDLTDVVDAPGKEPAKDDPAEDERAEDEPDVFAQTLANLRNLVAEKPEDGQEEPEVPEPTAMAEDAEEEEAEEEVEEAEETGEEAGEEVDEPRPAHPPPRPAAGSMESSLAALRELVEKAAAEDDPPHRPPRRLHKAKTPERPFSETLAALRGMLDLDKDEDRRG